MFGKIPTKIILAMSIAMVLATSISYGAHFNIDLLNLEESLSGLAGAYLKVSLEETWNKINSPTVRLTPVTIGIFDTGIDATHLEFAGTLVVSDVLGIVKFGNTPPEAKRDDDPDGHGTQVAGIIGASNISHMVQPASTSPQMNGVLSGAHNLEYSLEIRKRTRVLSLFRARAKIDDLAKSGAQIINISQAAFLASVVDLYLAPVFHKNLHVLFIVSAGNDGVNAETRTPARLGNDFDNVLTVGATDLGDGRFVGQKSASNFGGAVGISAPGDQVYAPKPFIAPLDPTDYDPNFTDTSAAAPLVTGVAGLLKAINPALTPAQLKNILTSTADPIFAPAGSDEADKLLGTACTASSTPAGMTKRGCRLNALAAVCHKDALNCEPTEPSVPIFEEF